jgi:ABC-2 type transport system ATP-binding protein
MAHAIETSQLGKRYRQAWAVRNLDLQLPEGAVFGFLGPNGAGKTTTIRMLLGLITPSQGGGTILGHDIRSDRAPIVRQVGAIVESPAFYGYLSGYDNLMVLARTADVVDRRWLIDVLHMMDLHERAKDKVKTYSLGMKQRLAIAAALLHNPKIIFLDEPTNGLDPAGTVEVRELIKGLSNDGHTIFLSSHLLHEVKHVCSDVAIINKGQMVTHGRVADLVRDSASLLVEAEPFPVVQAVAERMGVRVQQIGPRAATVALAPERAPELTAALVRAGANVWQITPQRSTLEQRFLQLTGAPHTEQPGNQPTSRKENGHDFVVAR